MKRNHWAPAELAEGFMQEWECREPEVFDTLSQEQREAVRDLAIFWFHNWGRYDSGKPPRPSPLISRNRGKE